MSDKKKVTNPNFWRSLKEYHDNDAVFTAKVNEFNDGVTDEFDPSEISPVSRRKFLALLSASAAFAVTSCTDYRDKGEIIPYTKRPEGVLPGKPNFYASTCTACEQNCGILVKTREGRPVKVDGNPDHPINKGKLCTTGQASILNLYDPDRLQYPLKGKSKTDWNEVDSAVISSFKKSISEGKEIAVLTGLITSPTTSKLLNDFVNAYPTSRIYSYGLFTNKNRLDAWKESYGSDSLPAVDFDKADVILSLDSDFLGRDGSTVENMRKYSSRRDVLNNSNFNRLYVAEGGMSLTGMNADYRLRVKPNLQLEFVLSLANEIALKRNASEIDLSGNTLSLVSKYSLNEFVEKYSLNEKYVNNLVFDLIQNKGNAIVYAGDTLSKETHLAVNLLNEILGNTPVYSNSTTTLQKPIASTKEIKELISKMNSGKVGVVIHFDTNPVYHLPKDLGYTESLSKVNLSLTFSQSVNETSVNSNYTLPIHNDLESWNDFLTRDNIYSLQQPVIAPLFDSRQKESALLRWINENDEYTEDIYHKYLMNNFEKNIYSKFDTPTDFKTFWYTALHDGVLELKNNSSPLSFNSNSLNNIKVENINAITLHLQKNYFIGDGRFANNGWLQETPHPVSKIAWDNYAAVSPSTASKLSIENDDVIKIEADGKQIEIAAFVQPGMADDLIVIELGYGRTEAGDVGSNVGFNANNFIVYGNDSVKYNLDDVNISRTGKRYALASTQEHHAIDDTFVKDFHYIRKIIQEGTLQEYKENPKFLDKNKYEIFDITQPHIYEGLKWGMAIDLNKCTSCAACVTSCNVENNVPVVGKEQVAMGREMQWMRIDRYYSGTPEEPVVSAQPMLCQHCDNAPCENVCPVNATNHSSDGLNQMAYNRCVGTRYCANNCPYKVRRFNFYNFRDHFANAYYENDLTALVNNPEVTVRSRGVMEKCTFCVQRIMDERENAIREGREIIGDNVKTACQVACPTDAIVFGNINDSKSDVAKYRNHELGYHVLESLNVRPNVTYLAKLRNTHSEEV